MCKREFEKKKESHSGMLLAGIQDIGNLKLLYVVI